MRLERRRATLLLAAGLVILPACVGESETAVAAERTFVKGGDEKTGAYDVVENWWKPAPDHDDVWTWGEVSGVAVDNPNRIVVSVWGDRSVSTQPRVERPNGSNYMVVVDGDGNMLDNWSQYDSLLNKAHQVYISPYDPERHVWLTEMGGAAGRTVYMSVMKFTNDGSKLAMRLYDPNHPKTRDEARANPHPAPFAYGNPAVLAFLPDGSFLLGDGYYNSRIIRYDKDGKYISEFGELGSGPGQFDLIHGLAVDADRIYVGDRTNNRVQVFTHDGEFIEEWPNITDPVGVFVDESNSVWVISARLNRILKYSRDGELLYHFGTYGGVATGGFPGGLARPHEIDVDQNGTLYVTSWDGGWVNKFVPKANADPSKLVGKRLVLAR